MNQGDRDYFKNREKHGFSHLNNYDPHIIIPRVRAIIEKANIASDSSVLDFGCAKGFYLKGFQEEGISAVGCDISEYAVNAANEFLKREAAFTDLKRIEALASKKNLTSYL